jgi:hypothetical protein
MPVFGQKATRVSEEPAAAIFRLEELRRRQQVSSIQEPYVKTTTVRTYKDANKLTSYAI